MSVRELKSMKKIVDKHIDRANGYWEAALDMSPYIIEKNELPYTTVVSPFYIIRVQGVHGENLKVVSANSEEDWAAKYLSTAYRVTSPENQVYCPTLKGVSEYIKRFKIPEYSKSVDYPVGNCFLNVHYLKTILTMLKNPKAYCVKGSYSVAFVGENDSEAYACGLRINNYKWNRPTTKILTEKTTPFVLADLLKRTTSFSLKGYKFFYKGNWFDYAYDDIKNTANIDDIYYRDMEKPGFKKIPLTATVFAILDE